MTIGTYDSTTLLIVAAIAVWILQAFLGWMQLRSFNILLQDLALRGRVLIGRSGRRWQMRTLVLICHDSDGTILDARVLHGLTVLARPKPLKSLIGASVPLGDALLDTLPRRVAAAVRVAYSDSEPSPLMEADSASQRSRRG